MSTYEYQNTSGRQQNTYIYGSSRIGEFNPEGFMECGALAPSPKTTKQTTNALS
jgi:hypothetical protein